MKRKKRGFSLIELMVVITIIAMLAGGVAIALFSALGDAKNARAKSDIADLAKAVGLFHLKTHKYPESLADLTKPIDGYPNGVVEEGIPKDPWGNDYTFTRQDTGFEIKSLGADGAEGGEGENEDISNRRKREE